MDVSRDRSRSEVQQGRGAMERQLEERRFLLGALRIGRGPDALKTRLAIFLGFALAVAKRAPRVYWLMAWSVRRGSRGRPVSSWRGSPWCPPREWYAARSGRGAMAR